MNNKTVKGIVALLLVTALSFGVIAGSRLLAQDVAGDMVAATDDAVVVEEYDVSSTENIDKAVKTEDGYQVTVRRKGYVGDVVLKVSFDSTGATVTNVEVVSQSETDGLGARVAEPEFLSQFANVAAPVYLPGMSVEIGGETAETEAVQEPTAAPETDALEGAVFADGTYEAKDPKPADNGFTEQVTMTFEGGKITSVVWDAYQPDGTLKSVMSENGEYVMTEDGPTWKEQAEALAAALIENQSLDFLTTDDQGKTDAVSGVSISVGGFISLAEECLAQAGAAAVVLTDGTYEAQDAAPADNGFTEKVSLTVEGGKITSVNWDAFLEDGTLKSVMSENGEYVMTEDGPTWKEQAEALAAALIENQSLAFLTTDAEGKTDAVSGVSISVGNFISLTEQCLAQAGGEALAAPEPAPAKPAAPAPENGTQVDAISGATVTSTATVNAINDAYAFLQTVK